MILIGDMPVNFVSKYPEKIRMYNMRGADCTNWSSPSIVLWRAYVQSGVFEFLFYFILNSGVFYSQFYDVAKLPIIHKKI